MNDQDAKKEEEALYETPNRWFRWKYMLPLALILLGITAGFIYWLQLSRQGFSRADLAASYEVKESSSGAGYASFGGGFLRYSADGVCLFTAEGREKWNISYSMSQPKLVMQGDYGAVADLSGRKVIVFSKNGLSGSYNTVMDIQNIAVSGGGLTAVSLDDGLTSRVQMYENSGKRLDIEMSFEMSLSGYPLTLALSPDGKGLVISFVSGSTTALSSQVAFYNFDVGKSVPDRLMGFFRYDGQLLPQLEYLSSDRVVAVGDSSVEVFSLAQENKPELLKSIPLPGRISVCQLGGKHIGLLYPSPSTGKMTLDVYDADGELSFSRETDGNCRSLRLETEGVLFLSDTGLSLISYTGKTRYSGSLSRTGQVMFMSGSRTIMQFDGTHIYRYRLK